MRIDAGGHYAGGDFFTGLEGDTGAATILDEDFVHGSLRADLHAEFASGGCNGIADGAGTSAAESPGAECAVDFAHVVMQENVCGAGRANAEEGADDSGGGHGGLEDVGLEPLV